MLGFYGHARLQTIDRTALTQGKKEMLTKSIPQTVLTALRLENASL